MRIKKIKARDLVITKNVIKKRSTAFIHNGKFLRKRTIIKNMFGFYIGEFAPTKKTGKTIHNTEKKKKTEKMKKQGIDTLLKKSKTIWKKNIAKNVKMQLEIGAGIATKKPPLSSILATSGINAENFINTFNTKTTTIFGQEGILIPTEILITPAKTFEMKLSMPTLYTQMKQMFPKWEMLQQMSEIEFETVLPSILYKINNVYAESENPTENTIYGKMRQSCGSIRSWDIHMQADHAKDKKRHKKKTK